MDIITTLRTQVPYMVTEPGVANLSGLTMGKNIFRSLPRKFLTLSQVEGLQ